VGNNGSMSQQQQCPIVNKNTSFEANIHMTLFNLY